MMANQEPTKIKGTFDSSRAGLSQPLKPLSEPRYTKWHLAISHGSFDQIFQKRLEKSLEKHPECRLIEIHGPNLDDFLPRLKRVGENYGWHLRKSFQPDNYPNIARVLRSKDTSLFVFQINGEEAGFCLATNINHGIDPDPVGITEADAVERFKQQRQLPANSSAIEIHKIGLYDEFTNQDYGKVVLGQVLSVLFNRHNYDIVYLNTRDTNHRGVVDFYRENGIDVYCDEILPNDLVSAEISQKHQPAQSEAPPPPDPNDTVF